MADLIGRRRLFVAGTVIFSVASLINGLATSDTMLIGARALQGFGAALISPAALSIITTSFREGEQRTKALAVWGAIAAGGAAVGLLLGGVLTEFLSWPWVFFVNVPIGVAVIVAAFRLVPESRNDRADASLRRRRRDHGDRWPDRAGLRDRQVQRLGLGLGLDPRPDRPRRCAAGLVRVDRAALARAAGAPRPVPAALAGDRQRGDAPGLLRGCSRCSTSAPCTCRRCSATRRSRPASRSCRSASGS